MQDSKFESLLHDLTSARDEKTFFNTDNFCAINNVYHTLLGLDRLGLDLEETGASTTCGSPAVTVLIHKADEWER